MSIRDSLANICPSWLRDGVAERFVGTLGFGADLLVEKMLQGRNASLPGRGDPSALPLLGADRLVARGLSESDDSYAERLRTSIDHWRRAGSARAVLEEALGFLLATTPEILSVLQSSVWDRYAAGADPTAAPEHIVGAANWDWDSLDQLGSVWARQWWRRWLVVFSTSPQAWTAPAPFVFGTPGVKIGQTSNSIGLFCSPDVIKSLRNIVDLRKSAGTWYRWIIVSFDDALFDPEAPAGGGVNPDGTFGRWCKLSGNRYVSSRFANARYCDGVA